jgi:anaerobic dimethyl sulfoxide reductase subunit A
MQIEKRYGLLDKTEPRLADVLDDPKKFDERVESIYKEAYETWAAKDDIKPLNPPSWDQFSKVPVFRVPHIGLTHAQQDKPPFNAYASFLADPAKSPLNTPSGKIEFYSTFVADPEMGTKEWIGPQQGNQSGICFGGASPTVVPPMAQFVLESNGPVSQYAEKYPLNVISLHNNYLQHHSQDNNPYRRELARHACWLSVADAKARGVRDGDLVRVVSEFGEIIMPAYVTPRIVPGSSNVGYGGWYEPSSVKTTLMPDGIDRRGMQNFLTPSIRYPWIVGCAPVQNNCQVEKFEA